MGARPSSTYHELAPPAELGPYASCLWVQRVGGGDEPYQQPVLPDGCIDVVAVGDRVVIAGPATHSVTLSLPPGSLTVGIRFRPGAAPAVVGFSAAELRDDNVPLDQAWGGRGGRIADRVADASGWSSRLDALADGLRVRLGDAREIDAVGAGVAAALDQWPARRLSSLADDFGLSERQLRRRVEDAVGYSPRTLARILRFQRFLRSARALGPGRHLARLAAESGYADQAHLTRESRELTGLPPAALLAWEAERLAA